MIILPNNDIWIYDDEEWKSIDAEYKELCQRESAIKLISQHEYKEFCHILANPDTFIIPRKLTTKFGGYWDANFNFCSEIFGSLCEREIFVDEDLNLYLMPWGEVFVVYTGVDSGGYDAELRIRIYASKEEYNKEFCI